MTSSYVDDKQVGWHFPELYMPDDLRVFFAALLVFFSMAIYIGLYTHATRRCWLAQTAQLECL